MLEKKQKKNIGGIIDKRYFTKEELQQHDRELVKKVCEKIKVWCENIENWTNDCNHRVLSLDTLNEFLNQIQKEYEK